MTTIPKITAACLLATASLSMGAGPVREAGATSPADRIRPYPSAPLNPRLLALPANRWVRFHQAGRGDWRREGHVGMTYDSKRGVLLFFGSATHGRNWDNAVHQFDPVSELWETHYRAAGSDTYGADATGNRIAGRGRLLPWAMHVYDGMVYDPTLDAMIVAARPGHNPVRKKLRSASIDPVWIYQLGPRRWRIMGNGGMPPPVVFAGGTAYDSTRDTIVVSRSHRRGGEVWELGPRRRIWVRAWRGRQKHGIHVTMGYDSRNRRIVVFGGYRATETVAVYTPGAMAGEAGSWKKGVPGGDRCPKITKTPIAYSPRDSVFLVVPRIGKTRNTATCVYDAAADRYRRIAEAALERGHMSFMMAYDARHDVFLMVTGDWRAPPIVWAFKLDLAALD